MTLQILTPVTKPTPHFGTSRRGYRPEAIVIHIAEGTRAAVDSWFAYAASQVSAHYLVCTDGGLHQYVREEHVAWHGGRIDRPTWTGLKRDASGQYVNPNLYTIGIEHEGNGVAPWPEPMLARSAILLAELHARWGIPLDRQHVVGHREIYAKKTCPGPAVNLDELVTLARAVAGHA